MNALPQTKAALPAPSEAPASEVVAFLSMIERASRDTNVNLDKLQRLLDMREREYARIAALRYREAMTNCQTAMEPIRADCTNEQARNSRYASLAALDAAARPIYTEHGFSLSYDTDDASKPEHVRVICKVYHACGHMETHHIDLPADGKGARGGDVMTRTHATGSAITYARRYLLGMVFNLTVERDDDGNAAGDRRQRQASPPPARARKYKDREINRRYEDAIKADRPRRAFDRPEPDDPERDIEAEAAEALAHEFIALEHEIQSAPTLAALDEWFFANRERIAQFTEGEFKNGLRKTYAARRQALQPPNTITKRAEAARGPRYAPPVAPDDDGLGIPDYLRRYPVTQAAE